MKDITSKVFKDSYSEGNRLERSQSGLFVQTSLTNSNFQPIPESCLSVGMENSFQSADGMISDLPSADPGEYWSNTVHKMSGCFQTDIIYCCGICNKHIRTKQVCGVRYCEKCLDERYAKNFAKMKEVTANFPVICDHIVLTSIAQNYSKDVKKQLAEEKRKMLQNLSRSHNLKFYHVGVYDLGQIDNQGNHLLHIHIMIAHNNAFYLNYSFLQKEWAMVTGRVDAVVRVYPKRHKMGLIKYFSKRASGDFGHDEDHVLFKDFMSVEEYDRQIKGSKFFFSFVPKALSCITTNNHHITCPFCGSDDMRIVAIYRNGMLIHGTECYFDQEIPPDIPDSPESAQKP